MPYSFHATPLPVFLLILVFLTGCAVPITTHPVTDADMGVSSSAAELIASLDSVGAVTARRITALEFTQARSDALDLESPNANTAGIEDEEEQTQIYFYVLEHPKFGLYLIDAGMTDQLREKSSFFLRKFFLDKVSFTAHQTTQAWFDANGQPKLRGVFLTHIHFDHIAGLVDLPKDIPLYVGRNETANSGFGFRLLGDTTDNLLEGFGPLRQWDFQPDSSDRFESVVDIFGDQSVWAIHVPGHTPGSTAYLVRTPTGPEFIIGDVVRTRVAWDHAIPQIGEFSAELAKRSADQLRSFAKEFPEIKVYLGHQD